jgi:serine/threonine protein kinase/Ca2+-binding EF-hand superfamily protein
MGNEISRQNALKRVFQKLDSEEKGVLTLNQILSVKKVPGVTQPITNSALLLLRFDEALEGRINFKEFAALLEHIRAAEKKVRERRLLGKNRSKKDKTKVWTAVSRETVREEFDLSPDAETPAFTGRKPTSDKKDETEDKKDDEEDLTEDIVEQLQLEAKVFFDQMIKTEQGRKKFANWLFKLADTDENNMISEKELTLVLKALRADGIHTENLAFDNEQCKEGEDEKIAKKLLEEFGKERTGFITQGEFELLAELILKNYELQSEYESGDIVGHYELKRKLGCGSSGEVRLAIDKRTGEKRAIKICPKGNIAHLSRLDNEIKAMMMLQHKHVVTLYEVLESEQHIFFVMELCGGGSLYEYLDSKPLSEDLARFYFSQMVEAIQYCHSKGVCHRDLKLDNLLLDNNANIKITDFGHAGIFTKGWDLFETPHVGGLCHVAPEQLRQEPYSGEKNDIWGLGVILYILLVGRLPFNGYGQQYLDNIKAVNYTLPDTLSPEAKDLIRQMLVYDPEQRISCDKIMQHPWLTMGKKDCPNLDRFRLPIQHDKEVWSQHPRKEDKIEVMCSVLKEIDVITLPPESNDENSMEVKCHWPQRELKFSFKLKEDENGEQYFKFKLREGESREFLSLMPQIRAVIEELQRNLTVNKKRLHTNNSHNNVKQIESRLSPNSQQIKALQQHHQRSSFITIPVKLSSPSRLKHRGSKPTKDKREKDSHKDKDKDKDHHKDDDSETSDKKIRKDMNGHLKDKESYHHRDKEHHKDKEKEKDKEKDKEAHHRRDKEHSSDIDTSEKKPAKEMHKDKDREKEKDIEKDKEKEKEKDKEKEKEKEGHHHRDKEHSSDIDTSEKKPAKEVHKDKEKEKEKEIEKDKEKEVHRKEHLKEKGGNHYKDIDTVDVSEVSQTRAVKEQPPKELTE